MISILMPAKNPGPILRQTLSSIQDQTFADWELVFVDNGSSDETLAIARAFQKRHRGRVQIFEQPGGNGNGCRLLAFQRASRPYVMWMDADDFLPRRALESQLSVLQHQPGVDGVLSDWVLQVVEAGKKVPTARQQIFLESVHTEPYLAGCLLHRWAPLHAFLFRRQWFENHGLNWAPDLSSSQDIDFHARNALAGMQLASNGHVAVFYNQWSNGQITRSPTAEKIANRQTIMMRWLEEFPQHLAAPSPWQRSMSYVTEYVRRKCDLFCWPRRFPERALASTLLGWHRVLTRSFPHLARDPYALHDLVLSAHDRGELLPFSPGQQETVQRHPVRESQSGAPSIRSHELSQPFEQLECVLFCWVGARLSQPDLGSIPCTAPPNQNLHILSLENLARRAWVLLVEDAGPRFSLDETKEHVSGSEGNQSRGWRDQLVRELETLSGLAPGALEQLATVKLAPPQIPVRENALGEAFVLKEPLALLARQLLFSRSLQHEKNLGTFLLDSLREPGVFEGRLWRALLSVHSCLCLSEEVVEQSGIFPHSSKESRDAARACLVRLLALARVDLPENRQESARYQVEVISTAVPIPRFLKVAALSSRAAPDQLPTSEPWACPRIGLCMMVRNKEAVLLRLLNSLESQIDAWCVSDTGSTDNTPALIRSTLGHLPGLITHDTWCDFGTNRTRALRAAREWNKSQSPGRRVDFWLLLDADHEWVVHEPSWKRQLTKDKEYAIAEMSLSRMVCTRLIPAGREYVYHGRAHECLEHLGAQPPDRLLLSGVTLMRHPDGSSRSEKLQRDLEFLQADLAERPAHPRTLFHLAQIYFESKEFERAVDCDRQRIRVGGWAEECYYSRFRIGMALEHLGRGDSAAAAYADAHQFRPWRLEALHALVMHHRQRLRHHMCHLLTQPFSRCPAPLPQDELLVSSWIWNWGMAHEFAQSAAGTGDFEAAHQTLSWIRKRTDIPLQHRIRIEELWVLVCESRAKELARASMRVS